MSRIGAIMGLYAETPLHPGTGQNVGAIDLPVQRERHTSYPLIPSSSLKGSLRSVNGVSDDTKRLFFGAELGSADHYAGSILLTDCRLLAFPVRSLQNVFFWTTSKLALGRLLQDLDAVGTSLPDWQGLDVKDGSALLPPQAKKTGRIVFEDLMLESEQSELVKRIASILADMFLFRESHAVMHGKMMTDLAVLSDRDFGHLVKYSTEVVARNQLDEKKASQNLWYMELVPRDSVFYTVIAAEKSRSGIKKTDLEVLDLFRREYSGKYVQLGGNETLGKGLCSSRVLAGDDLETLLGGKRD